MFRAGDYRPSRPAPIHLRGGDQDGSFWQTVNSIVLTSACSRNPRMQPTSVSEFGLRSRRTSVVGVDHHRGWSEVPPGLDLKWCLVFRFEDGKIKEVTNFCEDQHKADLFFNAIYTLKPLLDRLA